MPSLKFYVSKRNGSKKLENDERHDGVDEGSTRTSKIGRSCGSIGSPQSSNFEGGRAWVGPLHIVGGLPGG